MVKLPYGESDFKALIEQGYYYVDKTFYLEKLESIAKRITYLRPRRFGKSLFTSLLFNYYDIKSKDNFEKLFKNTYIYNNPTINKNNYYVLKFDFSGIYPNDNKVKSIEEKFKYKIIVGIEDFVNYYNFDYKVNNEYDCAQIFTNFRIYFKSLNLKNKIYVVIDEYDNFTNSLLTGDAKVLSVITGKDGFLKAFYSSIKEACSDSTVERVFITGVCSITLDSMTSGFNISTNITNDFRFNSMIGLTHEEVKDIIKAVENDTIKQKEIYNIMLEYYDGYLFNEELTENDKVFNATLVMNFLSYYNDTKKYPKELIDTNIFTGYVKLENLLTIKNNEYYKEIINDILDNNKVSGRIITNLNLDENFNKEHVISLLYYFGYLSIETIDLITNETIFRMPNKVIMGLYIDYFKSILNKNYNLDNSYINECKKQLILDGKVEKISNYISKMLRLSENRIFAGFDEKYIQMMYFVLLANNPNYDIYNEHFANGGYIDLYIKSRSEICKYDLIMELKYIKKSDYSEVELNKKISEGIKQINKYITDKRIETSKLKKYVVVFVKDEIKELKEI